MIGQGAQIRNRAGNARWPDPRLPGVVFGERLGFGEVLVSFDGGATFEIAIEIAHLVTSLALGPDARQLFVASSGGGIVVADLP